MAFDHEAHREHKKRIEEIDKKAGIGKYNPHNFTSPARSKALERKKIREGVNDLKRIYRNIKKNPKTYGTYKGKEIVFGNSHD